MGRAKVQSLMNIKRILQEGERILQGGDSESHNNRQHKLNRQQLHQNMDFDNHKENSDLGNQVVEILDSDPEEDNHRPNIDVIQIEDDGTQYSKKMERRKREKARRQVILFFFSFPSFFFFFFFFFSFFFFSFFLL